MNVDKIIKKLPIGRQKKIEAKSECLCWGELGRELGRKWLTANNLIKEIEGKMRDFQKKGKFNLEFKNKIDYKF